MSVNAGRAALQFPNLTNAGEAALPNFTGRSASFACGAIARVSLHIDDAQRIIDAKFQVAGCTALVAALSFLTERVRNTTTAEAALLAEDLPAIEQRFGHEAAGRGDCVLLASEALLEAIRAYSDSARDHWDGDDALICTCFGVSEHTIENEIQVRKLSTIAEVTQACNAGAGCRSCYPLIEDILIAVKSEEWKVKSEE